MKPLASEDLLDSECERTAWDKESVGGIRKGHCFRGRQTFNGDVNLKVPTMKEVSSKVDRYVPLVGVSVN